MSTVVPLGGMELQDIARYGVETSLPEGKGNRETHSLELNILNEAMCAIYYDIKVRSRDNH